MKSTKYMLVLLVVAVLAACAAPVEKDQNGLIYGKHYEILDVLPGNIEGFSFKVSTTYPDPWGYSLRYRYDKNNRVYSDIYIYPVPNEARGYSKEDIVNGMTNVALREIDFAKEKGAYSEFKIIESGVSHILGEYITKTDIYLVKNNLASYSLLFLTEKDGKLIKARMTMPDNEANRDNATWERFVVKVFSIILNNIDKA